MCMSPEMLAAITSIAGFILGLLLNRDKDPQWRGEVSAKLDMVIGSTNKVNNLERTTSVHHIRLEEHDKRLNQHDCEIGHIKDDLGRIGGRRKEDKGVNYYGNERD